MPVEFTLEQSCVCLFLFLYNIDIYVLMCLSSLALGYAAVVMFLDIKLTEAAHKLRRTSMMHLS